MCQYLVVRWRIWSVALASIMVVLICACSSHTTNRPVSLLGVPSSNQTIALYGGYPDTESFCAEKPLVGRIVYKVLGSDVTLLLGVNGLPHKQLVNLAWRNNDVRGYVVASFVSDTHGQAIQSSLRFFRPGEVRGVGLVVTSGRSDEAVVGRLSPC
jgi:hypothetical protein